MSKARLIGKHKKTMIFWGVTGAIVGAVSGFYFSPVGQILWSILGADIYIESTTFILLGTALGAAAAVIFRWFRSSVIVESVPVTVPVLGTVTLKFDERQRDAGWRMFVELASRIATQKLDPRSGLIREALTSLYRLFEIIRTELKSMPPTREGLTQGQADIESYALTIVNQAIRPCLARWHPRLKQWESSGMPEGEWPLLARCRGDLEITRQLALAYTWGLGRALEVSRLEALLPPEPNADNPAPQLLDGDELAMAEQDLIPTLANAQAQAGWRIYVEITTRIAAQALEPGSGLLREAMNSLHALFNNVRHELKHAGGPTPPALSGEPTVEQLALHILNHDIRPFLAKWHPLLREWEQAHPDKPESQWPEAQACRAELNAMQEGVTKDCAELARLIGMNPSGA